MSRLPDSFYFKAKEEKQYECTESIHPRQAIKLALDTFGAVSPAYLQRKCKISYTKAVEEINKYT